MAKEYDIINAFYQIENELIESATRNFKRHRAEETQLGYNWAQWQVEQLKALEQYRATNAAKYGKKFESLNNKLDDLISQAYASGGSDVEAKILKAVKKGFIPPAKPTEAATASFFRINESKLDALISSVKNDMRKVEAAVLRQSNDAYRQAIFNAQIYANTGAGTYEKAVDMARKDMLTRGLDCIVYKNGARHTLSDYCDMAIRTANKRAYLQGAGAKRQEWGIATVIVNQRQGGCPECAPFVGRVFIDDVWSGGKPDGKHELLSEAMTAGLYHPRCKDSHSTYFEGISKAKPLSKSEIKELEDNEAEELKRDYYERQAEKNERIADNSLDAENKRIYQARADEAEEAAQNVSSITSWELENYQNKTEKGLLITSKGERIDFDGVEHHVTGRTSDIELMNNGIFTHNHPTNSTFSQDDIVTGLVKGNLKELRAVSSSGDIYSLKNLGATEKQLKEFSAAFYQRRIKANNIASSKIRKGENINKEEYIKNSLELFMQENAKKYNLTYSKQKIIRR